jgi:hypothetical protein
MDIPSKFTQINEFINNNHITLFDNNKEYTVHDIYKIIFNGEQENHCRHCGNGSDVFYILEMNDGRIFYLNVWSGCLTYDPHNTIHSAKTFSQLMENLDRDAIKHCLPNPNVNVTDITKMIIFKITGKEYNENEEMTGILKLTLSLIKDELVKLIDQ